MTESRPWIYIPNELSSVFDNLNEHGVARKTPREEIKWLDELDKGRAADVFLLQREFLENSFAFMKHIDDFLRRAKWRELLVQTCSTKDAGQVLLALLAHNQALLRSKALDPDSGAEGFKVDHVQSPLPKVSVIESAYKGRVDIAGFHKYLAERYETIFEFQDFGIKPGVCSCSGKDVLEELKEIQELSGLDLEGLLKEVQSLILKCNSLQADAMWFGLDGAKDGHLKEEPDALTFSFRWQNIGNILCSLGILVGANVPRWDGDIVPLAPVAALQKVANNEGRAVQSMLVRLENQSAIIRSQQQAITALQFRHLLEMIPNKGGPALSGSATGNWQKFWDKAVTEAYYQHKTGTTPRDKDGNPNPSPLMNLLKPQFEILDADPNMTTDEEKKKWLQQTRVGQRATQLYGTLSGIIHGYRSREFQVNYLNYSTADVQILKALKPEEDHEKDIDWKTETERYLPAKPAGSKIPGNQPGKADKPQKPEKRVTWDEWVARVTKRRHCIVACAGLANGCIAVASLMYCYWYHHRTR